MIKILFFLVFFLTISKVQEPNFQNPGRVQSPAIPLFGNPQVFWQGINVRSKFLLFLEIETTSDSENWLLWRNIKSVATADLYRPDNSDSDVAPFCGLNLKTSINWIFPTAARLGGHSCTENCHLIVKSNYRYLCFFSRFERIRVVWNNSKWILQ